MLHVICTDSRLKFQFSDYQFPHSFLLLSLQNSNANIESRRFLDVFINKKWVGRRWVKIDLGSFCNSSAVSLKTVQRSETFTLEEGPSRLPNVLTQRDRSSQRLRLSRRHLFHISAWRQLPSTNTIKEPHLLLCAKTISFVRPGRSSPPAKCHLKDRQPESRATISCAKLILISTLDETAGIRFKPDR